MIDDKKQGFASMDEEEQKDIASKGGQASHDEETTDELTSEETEDSGKKGGEATKESQEDEVFGDIGRVEETQVEEDEMNELGRTREDD